MNVVLARIMLRGSAAGSRLRTALTVACIALGVALAGAVHTLHSSALAEIDQAARTLTGRADVEVRGARSGFDDALFERIASRPGVRVASPVLEVDAAPAGRGSTLRVLGIDPMRAVRLQPAFVAAAHATGSGSVTALLARDSVWLSPQAAARRPSSGTTLSVAVGTEVVELAVAGTLPGLDAAGEVAVMDIAAAQEVFGRVGSITRIDLALEPGVRRGDFLRALAADLPPGVQAMPAAGAGGRAASITRAYRVNLDALALVALATGAFLAFSTLALQAARRRQELALLRALGTTRRGVQVLLTVEGAWIGFGGAVLGTLLAIAASHAVLARMGADLGAGFFSGRGRVFAADPLALGAIALLAIAMAAAGAWWVGRDIARMDVAQALRDRPGDLPPSARGSLVLSAALFLAGIPLLFAPPVRGLPLAGYAAIGLWLAAAVAAVGPLARALLARLRPARSPLASLAAAQVRELPGQLAASIAGIVVSASLAIAMAIMVFSFRESLERWLEGVVGADLYVRAGEGESAYFPPGAQAMVARIPGVARVEPMRYDRLAIGDRPATLVARPIDARMLDGFQATPPGLPPRGSEIPVWISEAAADLHGWSPGGRIRLPLGGQSLDVRVAGVVRDYARTWGAVLVDIEEYRRVTGDRRANDLALHLHPGTATAEVQRAIRAALPQAAGLAFEDAAGIRARSLAIFDRTFAVTYALEAIAIAIGLAGITASFAALAWSRRREFAMLRFVGLRRRDVLRLLALEGAAAGTIGALAGLVAGVAISAVLVHVVNRQSFHWGMELHWPVAAVAAFVAALVGLCAIGARASGALAVRDEAVRATKDDA